MSKIPQKYSKKWLIVLIFLFLIIFISLNSIGKILNINIGIKNVSGFALLSIIISGLICIGGYFGAKAYFLTATISNAIGIIYMLYISINRTAEGWSDLVSIISYVLVVALGIGLGIIIQVVSFFISKRRRK